VVRAPAVLDQNALLTMSEAASTAPNPSPARSKTGTGTDAHAGRAPPAAPRRPPGLARAARPTPD